MGLQVSRSVRAQTKTESDLRPHPEPIGRDLPRAGEAEGVSDFGRTPDARPCAHVYRDSAQAPGRVGDRILEREERHCHRPAGGKERNFSGEHFWARGYAVSTVGFELEQVKQYIR